ncbi:hypothetical protein FIBSPDRAFT_569589 [Athelia psychrophila]|uniref:Uncharacterized protein n=1 Tax=Athelia psychrophila TaxID=1759441 RepID=A0A166HPP3_9AGAM|nr:hypothetical protein FIBSPDRAFT_569589 [Fibularhizoctonia sp. CBS 109695]
MDPSGGSDIETAAPPAVSSLRSRFEQLTVEKTSTPANKGRFGSRSPGPSSPRPRDVSGSQLYQLQDGELRAATAPSDLKTGIKRAPPPPPPPRTPQPTAATRPALSPLLRPVPTPSSPSINQQGLPVISPRVVSQRVGEDNIASPSSGGVAALRNKFV